MNKYLPIFLVIVVAEDFGRNGQKHELVMIDVIDLTFPTKLREMLDYFVAVDKSWKTCTNCGAPGLGTVMHMEQAAADSPVFPAIIPSEYLITRLVIIDVSALGKLDPKVVITLDVALQWRALRKDPEEPTLLLFKFGYKSDISGESQKLHLCSCQFPGISYELAAYISENLTHVVGVATDAPTLESEQTREMVSRTVANVLGKAGIYMVEHVNIRRTIPEQGCLAIVMPLKLLNAYLVPTRLTAFCPSKKSTQKQAVLALKSIHDISRMFESRIVDVNLDEILN